MALLSLTSLNQGVAPSATPTTPQAPVAKYAGVSTSDALASETQSSQTEQQPGYLSRVGSDIKNAVSSGAESEQASGSGKENPLEAGLDIAKDTTDAVAAPINEAIKPISNAIQNNPVVKAISDKISDSTKLQDFTNFLEAHPDINKVLGDTIGTASNIGALTGADETVEGGIEGAKTAADKVSDSVEASKPTPQDTAKTQLDSRIKDATPDYSKSMDKSQIKLEGGGTSPRVTESQGLTGKRVVNSASGEVSSGKVLNTVDNYPDKGTALEKFNRVQNEIGTEAEKLRGSIQMEDKADPITISPQKKISVMTKAIMGAEEDSVSLAKSDPVSQKYIKAAIKLSKNVSTDREGVLDFRQGLDDLYEKAGGKYAANKPLDDIHNAARTSATDLLADSTNSADVKASLGRQSALYRASDVLETKANAEAPTKFGRLEQKHPVLRGAVRIATRIPQRLIAGGIIRGIGGIAKDAASGAADQ